MPWAAIWFVWAIAEGYQKAVDQARRGIPENERGGVSLLPVFPVCPLIAWGFALLIDLSYEPWGTIVVCAIHVPFTIVAVFTIPRDFVRLRALDRRH